jgi:hypothetical protein
MTNGELPNLSLSQNNTDHFQINTQYDTSKSSIEIKLSDSIQALEVSTDRLYASYLHNTQPISYSVDETGYALLTPNSHSLSVGFQNQAYNGSIDYSVVTVDASAKVNLTEELSRLLVEMEGHGSLISVNSEINYKRWHSKISLFHSEFNATAQVRGKTGVLVTYSKDFYARAASLTWLNVGTTYSLNAQNPQISIGFNQVLPLVTNVNTREVNNINSSQYEGSTAFNESMNNGYQLGDGLGFSLNVNFN